MAAKKGGLGRGFDSLFSDNSIESNEITELRLSQIEPNRAQPRKNFDEAALRELADSIAKNGLIQPILVRPLRQGSYQIVAGERRWRASRMAGLEKVPVIIRELDDHKTAEIALIENLQREDLNPIEEAMGYKHLMENYSLSQEQIAEAVGKSRPAVANALRLLSLKPHETDALAKSEITPGHARALLSIEDGQLRDKAFEMAKGGATVREIERLSQTARKPENGSKTKKHTPYVEVEASLALSIGRKVKIKGNGKRGTIEIEFFSDEDLFDIAKKLAGVKQ